MFKTRLIGLISSLTLVLTGCVTDQITPDEFGSGLEFYPLSVSQSTTYEIDNTVFNIFGEQNEHFFQKETIVSFDTGYAIVSVSVADSLNGEFIEQSIYSIDTRDNRIITNKNSSRELELIYPFNKSTTFDRNSFNSKEASWITVDSVNTNLYVPDNGFTENNAVRLSTPSVLNNIQDIEFFRIYEEDKGLIYELDQEIETQPGETPIGFKRITRRL